MFFELAFDVPSPVAGVVAVFLATFRALPFSRGVFVSLVVTSLVGVDGLECELVHHEAESRGARERFRSYFAILYPHFDPLSRTHLMKMDVSVLYRL